MQYFTTRWSIKYNVFMSLNIKLFAKYIYEVLHICSARCAMCSPWTEPTYTAATYETTAVRDLQADHPSRRRAKPVCYRPQSSRQHGCNARIRRRWPLHSFLLTGGRCRGHTWWTSYRCGRIHHRHYLSTQPPAACSCLPRSVLWTYCTRRSTSCRCYVTATQTSAYSGRPLSADWAVRCRASSCRLRHRNRL